MVSWSMIEQVEGKQAKIDRTALATAVVAVALCR